MTSSRSEHLDDKIAEEQEVGFYRSKTFYQRLKNPMEVPSAEINKELELPQLDYTVRN
jgi:hypothetical protein